MTEHLIEKIGEEFNRGYVEDCKSGKGYVLEKNDDGIRLGTLQDFESFLIESSTYQPLVWHRCCSCDLLSTFS